MSESFETQKPTELDPPKYPVEPKVKASAAGAAGSAAIITPAVVLAVDSIWYDGGPVNVPIEYVGLIGLVVSGLCSLVAGYLARHVDRLPPA